MPYDESNDGDGDEERRNFEKRLQAEMQVEAFGKLFKKQYGITDEEIREFIVLLRWLKDMRGDSIKVKWLALTAFIMMAGTGLWNTFSEGVKVIFHR